MMAFRTRDALPLVLLVAASLAGCATNDGTLVDDQAPRVLTSGEIGNETGAVLKVVVIDPELFPVAQASVFVEPGDLEGVSDREGAVAFAGLDPGTYTVTIERNGYATTTSQTTVAAGEVTEALIEIQPTSRHVPYHTTLIFNAHLLCHFVFQGPPPAALALNAPCGAAIDLIAPGTSTDTWQFPFVVEDPGFSSLALEMIWEEQTLGVDGLMQLTTLGTAEVNSGGGVQVAGTVYGDTQAKPFHAVLHAGQSYWESDGEPVVFYPEENATETFQLLVAGGGGNGSLPAGQLALFLEFRPTSYVTLFHNRPATWSFTALPDE